MRNIRLLIFFIYVTGLSSLNSSVCYSQQPVSPLVWSYNEYVNLKEQSGLNPEWISIGPVVNSARLEAIQVDPRDPGTIYAAFGSGNLWKSTDHGIIWKAIFENKPSLGIGDIALAPSNSSVIYLGTGESLKKARNFTMPGNGVYRSDDAGETWRHLGLNDSWHIGEIAVHPDNPDIAVVAALGHFWTSNENRGLYLTQNGGETWEHVLYIDENTGANDVVFSPSNPEVLYATMWENYPGIKGDKTGVYKSSDGGKSWKRLTNGLPSGPGTGRTSVTVSYTNPDIAYVLVDNLNKKNGIYSEVYKTVNGGERWERTHKDELNIFSVIGWYFTDIYISPDNDNEIFTLGVRLAHSKDGGKTFVFVGGNVRHVNPTAAQGMHLDMCEMWVNPGNSDHLALANDGGLYISYDKGESWVHYNNIPAGEFYDIELDYREKYTIYGGTQDDATVFGPPKKWDPLLPDPWKYLWIDAWNGGDGCITRIDPEDDNIVYFSMQNGATRRRDMAKDISVSIRPEVPDELKDSVNYNFIGPYIISNHNPKTLYQAGNFVFKTTDRGDNWSVISPDLSISSDPDKRSLAAGTISESNFQPGILYVGTDRGACWISENDGKSWTEISAGLANGYIRSITPSVYKPGRVYLAMTGINYDDLSNYIYVSEDFGANWRQISSNLPDEPANIIIEDPVNENILYAGCYRGVYVSDNRGGSWSYLGKGMPPVSVADIEIHQPSMEMIAGTHGRGMYKLQLKPLQKVLSADFDKQKNFLFEIEDLRRPWHNDTHKEPNYRTREEMPVTFWLNDDREVHFEIINEADSIVWKNTYDGTEGLNEFHWDMVIKREDKLQPYFFRYEQFILPGNYRFMLHTGGEILSRNFRVLEGISPNIL